MITPEIAQYIRNNYHNLYSYELVVAINDTFNTNVTLSAVKNFKYRNRLLGAKPRGGRKGRKPWNTGLKKGDERLKNMEKTWFKKGSRPPQELPVGSETLKDGFVFVKIENGIWKRKSHIVWENHYGTPVPKKHMIIHADGNQLNNDIDNLVMIDWAVLLRMNKNMERYSDDADLTKAGVLISKIEQEIYKKNKKG